MRSTLDRHFLYRPYPALRIGIQVRAAHWQRKRFHSTCNDGSERPGKFGVSIVQKITTVPQHTPSHRVARVAFATFQPEGRLRQRAGMPPFRE
jgi:hypothetical protein